MDKKIKVHILYLGNPFHDSRIINLRNSLLDDGCEVRVTAFDWWDKEFIPMSGEISVFKLVKRSFSFSFYFRFFYVLFAEMMKYKPDIYFAEDIYCLPAVTIFAKHRRKKLYYNSRELYAYLGGLRNKKFVQSIIKFIEKSFIKKCDLILTTGEMDSEFLEKFYGLKNTLVVRNLPLLQNPKSAVDYRRMLGIEKDKIILLYQGAMLEGRGIQIIFEALGHIENTVLVLLGDGPKKSMFERKAVELNLGDRVFFLGSIPQSELINYTAGADAGLALIENISVSYYYALPNKLFEYIMAGVPVVSSNLPQMEKIVDRYGIGIVIDLDREKAPADIICEFIKDRVRLDKIKSKCLDAALELNWQSEYSKVKDRLLKLNR